MIKFKFSLCCTVIKEGEKKTGETENVGEEAGRDVEI